MYNLQILKKFKKELKLNLNLWKDIKPKINPIIQKNKKLIKIKDIENNLKQPKDKIILISQKN